MFYAKQKRYDGLSPYCKKCEGYLIKNRWNCATRKGKYKFTLSTLVNNSRKRAKDKGREHSITLQDIKYLLEKQQNRCAITGIEMTSIMDENYKGRRCCPPNRISLDRIDNKKGYTKDNIQLVCDSVNRFRNYIALDDFISFCCSVADNYRKK